VTDHLVAGTYGEALDVPVAHQRLPGLGLGEPAVEAHRLHEAGQLGRGGDVGAHDAARSQCAGGGVDALPGSQHVQDHPVVALPRGRELLGEVAEAQGPGRVGLPVRGTEELGDVAAGDVGELLAALVGRELAVGTDGAQERAGERTRADPGLDDVGAGEDVGHGHDLRGVLGVDHGGTARHRHHELREQRAEDEVLAAGRRRDREALLTADQVVVGHPAAVGVERLVGLEADVVLASLGVDQAHPFAGTQGPAVDAGPGFRRDVAVGGVSRGHRGTLLSPVGHWRNARSTSAVDRTP
jgi:hypothetical protein